MKGRLLVGLLLAGAAALGLAGLRVADHPLPPGVVADKVVVNKSARGLTLWKKGQLLKSYPVALGRAAGKKVRQGDGRTPEGVYVVTGQLPQSSYYRALHISYPNADDRRRAREGGFPPGGDIMIHGLPRRWAWVGRLHSLLNWTRGCIAVSNAQMDELWRAVPVGTTVVLQP